MFCYQVRNKSIIGNCYKLVIEEREGCIVCSIANISGSISSPKSSLEIGQKLYTLFIYKKNHINFIFILKPW